MYPVWRKIVAVAENNYYTTKAKNQSVLAIQMVKNKASVAAD